MQPGQALSPLEKTWDELHKSGELESVKLQHPEIYKLKFKEHFGKVPKH